MKFNLVECTLHFAGIKEFHPYLSGHLPSSRERPLKKASTVFQQGLNFRHVTERQFLKRFLRYNRLNFQPRLNPTVVQSVRNYNYNTTYKPNPEQLEIRIRNYPSPTSPPYSCTMTTKLTGSKGCQRVLFT